LDLVSRNSSAEADSAIFDLPLKAFFLPLFSAGTRVSRFSLPRAAVGSCSQLAVPWFVCVWVKAASRDSSNLTPLVLSFFCPWRDRFSLFIIFSSYVFFVVVDLIFGEMFVTETHPDSTLELLD
jgi:hypothetical protein